MTSTGGQKLSVWRPAAWRSGGLQASRLGLDWHDCLTALRCDCRSRTTRMKIACCLKLGVVVISTFTLVCLAIPCLVCNILIEGLWSPGHPSGDGTLEQDFTTNKVSRSVGELCRALVIFGAFYFIQNRQSSYLSGFGPNARLTSIGLDMDLDQYSYMHSPPRCYRARAWFWRLEKPTSSY